MKALASRNWIGAFGTGSGYKSDERRQSIVKLEELKQFTSFAWMGGKEHLTWLILWWAYSKLIVAI